MSSDHEPVSVDVAACRGRQRRLLDWMQTSDAAWVVLTQMEHIQWLTGARFGPLFQPAAAMSSEGYTVLVAPDRALDVTAAADQIVGYEAQWHSTLRNNQRSASTEALFEALPPAASSARVAIEFSTCGPEITQRLGAEPIDAEPTLYRIRRRKDSDELRMMRRGIDATRAMYEHAREAIRPGVNELDLYTQLYHVATRSLGEAPTYFGQDFQSNARGGMPRDRQAREGELWILDLGAGFRGYFSDNARTLAVGAQPTDDQLRAWEAVTGLFPLVESTVGPGVSCRELFEQAQATLDAFLPWEFNHHLGHGVGLFPHEAPHLNPNWDDRFEVGDFFTVEPGLYHDQLRHGLRIEQNYLVTEDGVELLTDFPLEL